jgi:hypothetical protein
VAAGVFALIEPERHSFRRWTTAFVAAFAATNQHRIWDPAEPQARRALRWRRMLGPLLAVTGVLLALWDL